MFFFSIHALRGAKGEDAQVFAPVGISVTTDDGRILGHFIYTPLEHLDQPGVPVTSLTSHLCLYLTCFSTHILPPFHFYITNTILWCFFLFHIVLHMSYLMVILFFILLTLGELNCEEDRLLVAKGGHGGALYSGFLPSKGQTRQIRLDLKLIADLGLVGWVSTQNMDRESIAFKKRA